MQPNEISEEMTGDEVDSTGSSCGDNPRSNKPLMEKRRRARINKSLNELKTMLLQALKGNSCGHSKLEKADILEMTVRYMRKLEQHKARTTRIDPSVLNKYKAGFSECRNEVMKFLSTHEGVSVEVRTRLLDHLANCQQTLQDQDQEDFMDEEFVDDSCWRQSPTGSEDNAMRMSPSTSQEKEPATRPSLELQQPLVPMESASASTSHVGGQIQIISTESLSPSSVCSNAERLDSNLMQGSKETTLARNPAFLHQSPHCHTCADDLVVHPTVNGSQSQMHASKGQYLVMGHGRLEEHPRDPREVESRTQEKYAIAFPFPLSNTTRNISETVSSRNPVTRPYLHPQLRTIDYRQLHFSHSSSYTMNHKSSTHNHHTFPNISQQSKEPWRPW